MMPGLPFSPTSHPLRLLSPPKVTFSIAIAPRDTSFPFNHLGRPKCKAYNSTKFTLQIFFCVEKANFDA
jgi:hypothetical protein